MALSRLGDFIEPVEGKNNNGQFGLSNIKGISTKKEFIPTKANMDGISLTGYKIVNPMCFAYVADTSRRGNKISLAFNDTNEVILVSSITTVFRVKPQAELLPFYLFMYFNRPEFDRYSRFNSWGSAREAFGWENMCDIEIDIPPIEVQQKVVDVYLAMVANQKAYEKGLEDLKLTCDAFIENLNNRYSKTEIGDYLVEVSEKNAELKYSIKNVKGVSKNKEIIPTKADSSGNDLSKFIIIREGDFVYNPRSANAIALNTQHGNCIISWNNTAFRINRSAANQLIPKYLNMWFSRNEYSRWAKYNSWGSSTELLSFEEIRQYSIPIPPLNIQTDIVKVFEAYEKRKQINENLKKQINEICPVLIKGSISM